MHWQGLGGKFGGATKTEGAQQSEHPRNTFCCKRYDLGPNTLFAVIEFTEKPLHKEKTILVVSTLSIHEAGPTPFFSGRFSVIDASMPPWSYLSTYRRLGLVLHSQHPAQ